MYEVVTIFSLFSTLVTHGTIFMRNVISRLNKCVISKGWPWQIQVKNGLWMEVIYICDEKNGFFSGNSNKQKRRIKLRRKTVMAKKRDTATVVIQILSHVFWL